MMENVYLQEAFKALDILNEEDFNLTSTDGFEDAKDFIDKDEKSDFIDVIDPEAETEEELKDSYVGDVILDCCVCHSKLYKHPEEVHLDEEEGLANMDEECPFCYSTDGYTIIGQVAPFEEEEKEEIDDEVEIEDEVDDDVNESFKRKRKLKEAKINMGVRKYYKTVALAKNWLIDKEGKTPQEASDIINTSSAEDLEKMASNYLNKDESFGLRDLVIVKSVDESLKSRKRKLKEDMGIESRIFWDIWEAFERIFLNHPEYQEVTNKQLRSITNEVLDEIENKYPDGEEVDESLTEGILGTGIGAAGGAALGGAALGPLGALGGAALGGLAGNALTNNNLTEDADISEYQKWVDFDMEKYGKISNLTMRKIKKAGFSVVKDQYGEYEVIADRKDESCEKKPVREHFEKVEIETDKEKMEMTAEENGKVVVTTEPKNDEEVIVPVSDDIQTEINDVKEIEDEPIESGEFEDGDYEDIDVDEFSEEEFDDLGESYLKKVYENVKSFKTSNVKTAGNKLFVEGIIGFASGKNKKTSFVFESKDVNKKGKVRFIGENLQLSRGKKAFTITGSINKGKFIAESLNYNYRAKDSEGKSTRLYGTVRTKK